MGDQSRLESFVESCVNTFIGFAINFAANWYLLPLVFGIRVTLHDNLILGALFTIISVARSYVIRRFFNSSFKSFSQRIAGYIKS